MSQNKTSIVPIVILVGALILFGVAVVAVSAWAVWRATEDIAADGDSGPLGGLGGGSGQDWLVIDHTDQTLIAPDHVIDGTFTDGEFEHVHVFAIPEDTVLVRATVRCDSHDVDVAMTFSEDSADDDDWDVSADTVDGHEWIWSFRKDKPAMADGRCFVHVEGFTDDDEYDDDEISYTLTMRHVRYHEDGELRPGEPVHGQLTPRTGHRRTYTATWPEDADSIRFDVLDATQDVDVFVGFEPLLLDLDEYDLSEEGNYCTESIVIPRNRADGDTVLVTVIDQECIDTIVPFTLLMTADGAAPAELRTERPFPPPRTDIEKIAQAVVRLDDDSGHGSGVLLTDDGLVLTAQHVVGDVGAELVVSILVDPGRPPLESYLAKVIRANADLDVALVQIDAMLDGSPLPESVRFPTLPVRWRDEPTLGDPAFVCGFHDFDEAPSRDLVSWTTGAVSGWQETEFEPLLRIDANVASGASGGAVLDGDHRLIGIVLLMHGAGDWNTAGETGAGLVTRLPPDWVELSRAGR